MTLQAITAQTGNSCSNAIAVTAGLHSVSSYPGGNLGTSCIPGNNPNGNNSIWFRYTATGDQSTTIALAGSSPLRDTRLHVFEDNCTNLICIAGNDDVSSSNFTSSVTFPTTSGESYLVVWDNYWNSGGFTFEIEEIVPPPPAEFSFTFSPLSSIGQLPRAAVDVNNDGLDDLVGVNYNELVIHQQDVNGNLQLTTIPTDRAIAHMPFWSLAAADYDKNGYIDFVMGDTGGVTFLLANQNGTEYKDLSGGEYVFTQRTNFVDINNDGHLDAFVCHDVQPNVYYLNDGQGDLQFFQGADPSGITTGLGLFPSGGNYGSVWVDYDNDRDMDLFIAKCRGGNSQANVNELHRNNGDGSFTNVSSEQGVNMADPIQTWSSAWGDYDNDGDMDAFIGASSTANGSHKMMRNNGDGTFTSLALNTLGNLSSLGFGIENTPVDFNNDGLIDIYSNGEIARNDGNWNFTVINTSSNNIPSNGALGDLNRDGYLDVFNNQGLYLNAGGANNWLGITLQGNSSNANGIGARIEVASSSLGTQIREIRSGEGFRYMSSLNAYFGLAQDNTVDVTIYWPSGVVDNLNGINANQRLTVVESSTASIDETRESTINIFPNPAADRIFITSKINLKGRTAQVMDLSGKVVKMETLHNNQISVSDLDPGLYFISFDGHDQIVTGRFIKK